MSDHFAVVDVGSNAIRWQIAAVDHPKHYRIIEQERQPVRLGHEVFRTGKLDARAADSALRVFRDFSIDRPIDHYTGGRRGGAVKPRVAVLRPAAVREHETLGPVSQIEPYTYRIDRARIVESARRRIIASRVSALYYKLYDYL